MNLNKRILIGMFFLTNSLLSNCLEGSVLKILNDQTTESFIQERIYFRFPSENILWTKKTKIDKNSNFYFPCGKFPKPGKEIQLKLSNKDYFILSPFNGKLFVPNKGNIHKKILVIHKKSPIFLKSCMEIDYQTIQVSVTKNKAKAEKLVNILQRSCSSKKGRYYCRKNIKFEAFLEHDILNNLAYKVYYGKYYPDYKSQKELKKTLQFIRKYYSKKAWIRRYIKEKEECR